MIADEIRVERKPLGLDAIVSDLDAFALWSSVLTELCLPHNGFASAGEFGAALKIFARRLYSQSS